MIGLLSDKYFQRIHVDSSHLELNNVKSIVLTIHKIPSEWRYRNAEINAKSSQN